MVVIKIIHIIIKNNKDRVVQDFCFLVYYSITFCVYIDYNQYLCTENLLMPINICIFLCVTRK